MGRDPFPSCAISSLNGLAQGHAPETALLWEGQRDAWFWAAYKTMTDALRPWTFDFHVAQNDGTVHGTGSHDKTGRHCPANDVLESPGTWNEVLKAMISVDETL